MKCFPGNACQCENTPPRTGDVPPAEVVATDWGGTASLAWLLSELRAPTDIRSVALKLNLCEYRLGESGATTNVEFVAATVEALRGHAPGLKRIVLLEHDSSGTRSSDLFALLGFARLAAAEGLELFDGASAGWRQVGTVGGLPVELPEVAFDVDLFVNLPKLKFHGKTVMTGALKNNFGLVKRKWKLPYHARLCETIVASNVDLPRQLVLMDGCTSLSGRGPAYGVPVRSGVVLGSWDPVAIDAAAARLLRLPLALVPQLRLAASARIGTVDARVRWRPGTSGLHEKPTFDWSRYLLASILRRS